MWMVKKRWTKVVYMVVERCSVDAIVIARMKIFCFVIAQMKTTTFETHYVTEGLAGQHAHVSPSLSVRLSSGGKIVWLGR